MSKVNLKQIQTAIGKFTTNRDQLRDQAHTIAMMIFYHAAPEAVGPDCNGTGDCTQAGKLLAALPKSWQPQMRTWFDAFTPIRISADGSKVGYEKKYTGIKVGAKYNAEEATAAKLKWWKLEEANTTPYHELSEEADVKTKVLTFDDLLKMAEGLGKRITKIVDDEDDRNVIKPEDVARAKVLATVLATIKVDPVKAEAANDEAAKAMQAAAA